MCIKRRHFVAQPGSQNTPSAQINEDKPIPTETYTLMALGVGAILVAWLIFSVFKKILGLLFLAALAFGAWTLWNNPALMQQVMGLVGLQ